MIAKLIPSLLVWKTKWLVIGIVRPLRSHVRGRDGSLQLVFFRQGFSSPSGGHLAALGKVLAKLEGAVKTEAMLGWLLVSLTSTVEDVGDKWLPMYATCDIPTSGPSCGGWY